ncbi:MAG: hypothetical protein HKP02_06590, partial [Xanthomonadales bacterium]|nr:hypothetical protein [Xanthomonadales bacterium]
MRKSHRKRRQFGTISSTWALGILAFILIPLMPSTAFAQNSCNSRLLYVTDGPSGGMWFPGDEITVTAVLGALEIEGGSYLDIPDFGFAMDCQETPGLVYNNCFANGHDIRFLGDITPGPGCVNAAGAPISFPEPQSSFIDFIPLNGPLRIQENQNCVISWKFEVDTLNAPGDSTERIWQVVSFPLDRQDDPAMCNNGLTTAQDRAGFIDIDTCSISVEKQICSPDTSDCTQEQNWYNADTQAAALLLSPDGLAAYRAIITNNGSVPYLGDITVDDDTLNIDTTISGLDAGESVTIGGAAAQATWSDACSSTTDIMNSLTVGAQCRAGNVPKFASATDVAWGDCERFRIRMPKLVLDKTASPMQYNSVGQQISYSYELTNDGNVSLYPPYSVADDKATVSCPGAPAELPVGQSVICSATYSITQADLNNGSVTNIATATAKDEFNNDVVSNEDTVTVTAIPNPALSLVKSGVGPDNDYDAVGDVLSYSYLVTNSGNVSLAGPVT